MTNTAQEARAREVLAAEMGWTTPLTDSPMFGVSVPIAIRAMLSFAQPEGDAPAIGEGIPAGMKPWHGGDSAPADWDGGPVYLATGTIIDKPYTWASHYSEGYLAPSRVAAYAPKPTRSPYSGDALREALAEALFDREVEPFRGMPNTEVCSWANLPAEYPEAYARHFAEADTALAALAEHQSTADVVYVPRDQLREWYTAAFAAEIALAPEDENAEARPTPKHMREMEALLASSPQVDRVAELEAEVARLREALEWALAEIDGRTRYDHDAQRENARACADTALSTPIEKQSDNEGLSS